MKYDGILNHWSETINYKELMEICEAIKKHNSFSSPFWWMCKAFQFGYAYGKAAVRAKKHNEIVTCSE